ncbi:MAG TPA: D-alanyl-D-alanine carboxypeptidase, partial [Pedobacter sp.]
KLADTGIVISGPATTARRISLEKGTFEPARVIIDRYHSPELSKVVYWLNQKSLNLYAENILKTMAIQQGREGSFDDGVEVVQDYWNKRAAIDPNSLDILDVSGLSPENRITTLTMAKVLQSAWKEPWFNSFYESIPVYNGMKMKSGSIRNVLAYAGYEKSSDGTPLVFSFITNHYNGSSSSIRQKMFNVLDVMK